MLNTELKTHKWIADHLSHDGDECLNLLDSFSSLMSDLEKP